MTKRSGRSVGNDAGLQAIFNSPASAVCLVGKSSEHQVKIALGISGEENLKSLREIRRGRRRGRQGSDHRLRALLRRLQGERDLRARASCGRRSTPARAGSCCATPMAAPCRARSTDIVRAVMAVVPGDKLGIHAHDDTGQAVANSLAAVEAGVRQIQGTLNGIGERCGNANLVTLIPTLVLKPAFADRFETGVGSGAAGGTDPRQPRLRRSAQPRLGPAGALCRRVGLCHQGGHPRLGARQGPLDL